MEEPFPRYIYIHWCISQGCFLIIIFPDFEFIISIQKTKILLFHQLLAIINFGNSGHNCNTSFHPTCRKTWTEWKQFPLADLGGARNAWSYPRAKISLFSCSFWQKLVKCCYPRGWCPCFGKSLIRHWFPWDFRIWRHISMNRCDEENGFLHVQGNLAVSGCLCLNLVFHDTHFCQIIWQI